MTNREREMTTGEDARAALQAAVDEALDDYSTETGLFCSTEMVLLWSRASDEAKAERDAMERELLMAKQEQRVAVAAERAAVVKYLRDNQMMTPHLSRLPWHPDGQECCCYGCTADAIEKGEHHDR